MTKTTLNFQSASPAFLCNREEWEEFLAEEEKKRLARRRAAWERREEEEEEKEKQEIKEAENETIDDLRDALMESIEYAEEKASRISETLSDKLDECCKAAFNKVAAGKDYLIDSMCSVRDRIRPVFDRLTGYIFDYVSVVGSDVKKVFNEFSFSETLDNFVRWNKQGVETVRSSFMAAVYGKPEEPKVEPKVKPPENHFAPYTMISAPSFTPVFAPR